MKRQPYVYALAALLIGCVAPGPGDEPGSGAEPAGSPDAGADSEPRQQSELEQGLDLEGISGNLRLYLTDAPADLDEVWVEVSKVEVSMGTEEDEAWVTITEDPLIVDLLTLQDSVTTVLGDAALEPGAYQQLRFVLADAWAVEAGETRPLTIPSGTQTGIKINLDVEIEADAVYAVVLDFDARESIHETGNGMLMMAPVIKVAYVGVVEGEEVEEIGDEPMPEGEDADAGAEPAPEPDAAPVD
jgi:hypothetical protein